MALRWTHNKRRLRIARIHTRELVTWAGWRHMMKITMWRGVRESVVCARGCWQRVSLWSFSRAAVSLLRWYRATLSIRSVHFVDVVIVSHQRDLERHAERLFLFFRLLNNSVLCAGEKFLTQQYLQNICRVSVCVSFTASNVLQNSVHFLFCERLRVVKFPLRTCVVRKAIFCLLWPKNVLRHEEKSILWCFQSDYFCTQILLAGFRTWSLTPLSSRIFLSKSVKNSCIIKRNRLSARFTS